jgi:hypothetical protein
MLHIVAAGVGFLGLVAACVAIAIRFNGLRRRGWALFSVLTAVVFLFGFAGVASGSGSPIVVLLFWAALLVAWTWLAAVSIDLYREVTRATR